VETCPVCREPTDTTAVHVCPESRSAVGYPGSFGESQSLLWRIQEQLRLLEERVSGLESSLIRHETAKKHGRP